MTTRASRACAASQRRAARGWWCRSSAQSPWVGRDQFFKLLDFEAWAHLSLKFDRFMNIQFGWAKPFFRASAVSEHITRREYLYESFEIHVRDSLAELWECSRPQKSSISNFKKIYHIKEKNLSYERPFENKFLENEKFPNLLVVTRWSAIS